MVDTRKLKQFIKIADLTASDDIQFTNEGSLVEKDFSKAQDGSDVKTILEMMVSLNGEEPKKLTVNNTTINILKKHWGPDSVDWVNKRAKVSVVPTVAFGELKDINVLVPVEGVSVSAPTQQEAPQTATPPPAAEPAPLTPEQQANVDAGKGWDE